MKQKAKLLSAVVIFCVLVFCSAKAQMTAQDGRTYKTVKIGNQTWMAENLNVSTYRNGDSIPQFQENGKRMTFKMNVGWTSANKGAWCYYETQKAIDTTYGKLYNWFVVNDPRGLAPVGWHIPTNEEWKQLSETLRGKDEAGSKMKSIENWVNERKGTSGNGTNESGFTGLPGGFRHENGNFIGKGFHGAWWGSTKRIPANSFVFSLSESDNKFRYGLVNYQSVYAGLSVRCIKD